MVFVNIQVSEVPKKSIFLAFLQSLDFPSFLLHFCFPPSLLSWAFGMQSQASGANYTVLSEAASGLQVLFSKLSPGGSLWPPSPPVSPGGYSLS